MGLQHGPGSLTVPCQDGILASTKALIEEHNMAS